MPKHYKVKKAMAGAKTKLADKDQMLMAKRMPGGGHTNKAPMYMMGGKTYADMGAMIKAEAGSLIASLAKNPKTRAQMEAAVGKK